MKEGILLAKRKNTSNSASKSGMFFHFAVNFELFKEFCCIHKNYVVFFNLIEGDIGVCGIAVMANFSCGISVILI